MVKVFTIDELNDLREQALASKSFAFVSGIVDRILNSDDVAVLDCVSQEGFPIAQAHLKTIVEIKNHYSNCSES